VPATGQRPLHSDRNLDGRPVKQDGNCEDATIAAGAAERRADHPVRTIEGSTPSSRNSLIRSADVAHRPEEDDGVRAARAISPRLRWLAARSDGGRRISAMRERATLTSRPGQGRGARGNGEFLTLA
jgi:hypothetical protein